MDLKTGNGFDGNAFKRAEAKFNMGLKDVFKVECFDKNGNLKWVDYIENLVVNEGLNDALDKYFKGSGYTAAHYVGLTDSTPNFQAGDTAAQIGGTNDWAEVTAYDEAARQTATWGSVSGQSVDNSASKAVFTIDTNSTTIGGAFLATSSVKGGTSGVLYGGGAFAAGDKTLDDNDVINVTVTATAAAS